MQGYPEKVYLNGQILNSEDARISVFDRGFLFGDGIYEVMVRINGRFFYGDAHLDRLNRCLKEIQIDFDTGTLPSEINRLLNATNLVARDCLLYIQITRGVAPRTHSYPKDTAPTLMMYAIPKVLPKINAIQASVVTAADFRWSRCDIKMTSLLGNVMMNEFAMKQGCFETLLIRDGIVTEASHCNVFFVKEEVVYTHPANEYILDGITRQVVLELCRELDLEVKEVGVSKDDIPSMDEAFLTGTSTQIASIKQLDDHLFYTTDKAGKVTRKLQNAFHMLKGQPV